MLKIGLTGGIGSGKTTVANYFKQLGVCVIDSDSIAHHLITPNQPAYSIIIQKFGKNLTTTQGEINRKKLREIVFDAPLEKKWLEDLLHPLIKRKIAEEIRSCQSKYCLIVIPLLIETKSFELIDRILVVDSPIELQIRRTKSRDHCDENIIKRIIQSQSTRQERNEAADDIILNDKDIPHLKKKVFELHQFYLKLTKF